MRQWTPRRKCAAQCLQCTAVIHCCSRGTFLRSAGAGAVGASATAAVVGALSPVLRAAGGACAAGGPWLEGASNGGLAPFLRKFKHIYTKRP